MPSVLHLNFFGGEQSSAYTQQPHLLHRDCCFSLAEEKPGVQDAPAVCATVRSCDFPTYFFPVISFLRPVAWSVLSQYPQGPRNPGSWSEEQAAKACRAQGPGQGQSCSLSPAISQQDTGDSLNQRQYLLYLKATTGPVLQTCLLLFWTCLHSRLPQPIVKSSAV